MSYFDWLKVNINNEIGSTCPDCKTASVENQYVGDQKTRIGFLCIWCSRCNHGIRISRVSIPIDKDMLDINLEQAKIQKRIPKFVEVKP